jgi:hypothetical protein
MLVIMFTNFKNSKIQIQIQIYIIPNIINSEICLVLLAECGVIHEKLENSNSNSWLFVCLDVCLDVPKYKIKKCGNI